MFHNRTSLVVIVVLTVLISVVFYGTKDLTTPTARAWFNNYVKTFPFSDSNENKLDVLQRSNECPGNIAIKRNKDGITEVFTACSDFTRRVDEYNLALQTIRDRTLKSRRPEEWHGPTGGNLTIVWGVHDDFLQKLGKYPEVQTVSLPWIGTRSSNWTSLTDKSNLLINKYYEWTASDRLCQWVETPHVIKMKYDVIFNRTCSRNLTNMGRQQSLQKIFLHEKPMSRAYYWPNNGLSFPEHFYRNTTPYVFYMNIVTDALVTGWGDIYGKTFKIVPYGCSRALDPRVPPGITKVQLYDEVFVVSQYWGRAVYHRMGEIIPRLAGWLGFLKQNPQIRIFAPDSKRSRLGEILPILGLDPDRLVGGWVRAKVAYVPRASYCGMPSIQESQIVSSLYRKHIEKVLGTLPRKTLLLIRRSRSRKFTEQKEIEKVLERLAKEYGLKYEMYKDNPSPSFNDTMRLFHSAALIVAPHGAGLSNVYFSQPGTYIIEGVCNLPHVNFCFQRLSVILGHRWHGINSRGGCEGVVDVAAKDIEAAARVLLNLIKEGKLR